MVNYTIDQHAWGAPAKVLASKGGKHIYNIQLTEDTDNTWFLAKGDFIELDLYEEKAPTTFSGKVVAKAANGNYYVEVVTPGDALFVYNVPMIEEDYNNKFKVESNFFNYGGDSEKGIEGDVVRAYELAAGDILEISANGFKTTPTVDATVSLQAMVGKTYAKQLG